MRRAFVAALLPFAAGPAEGAFERLPAGPEAAALGGMLTVSPDGVFGNPAPARPAPRLAARAWGSRPFGLAELREVQASVTLRLGWGSAGLGVRRFGSAAYAEKELRLAGGWAPAPALAVGGAVRGLVVTGTGFSPRRSIAVDAGLRFRPAAETEISAVLEAVLGEVPGDPVGSLRRTAVGSARRFGTVELRIEVQRREDGPLGGVVGVEWTSARTLVLRAGARGNPPSAAWGFSVLLPGFELAASATHAALGRTVRIGVAIPGGRPAGASEGIAHPGACLCRF